MRVDFTVATFGESGLSRGGPSVMRERKMGRMVPGSIVSTLRYWSARALMLLTACADPSGSPGEPIAYQLLTTQQWSGGSVDIRSASFAALTTLPVFTIGVDTLAATRLDAVTLQVTLPPLQTGGVSLLARSGARADTVGVVSVYGVGLATTIPGDFSYDMSVLPGARPRFIAQGTPPYHVAVLDPVTGQIEEFSGVGPMSYGGIAVGPMPNRFVLIDSTGRRGLWSLFPTPTRLDSTPTAIRGDAIAQLTDSTWMGWSTNDVSALNASSGAQFIEYVNNAQRLILSPRGDRATVAWVDDVGAQIPVIDMLTGMRAFVLPGVVRAEGAAFSPGGDTLYVATRKGGEDSLRLFTALDGTPITAIALPAGLRGGYITLDPRNASLFVLARGPGIPGVPVVLVYDRFTLQLQARLACPGNCTAADGAVQAAAVDTVANRLWVVGYGGTFSGHGELPLIGFDLLP